MDIAKHSLREYKGFTYNQDIEGIYTNPYGDKRIIEGRIRLWEGQTVVVAPDGSWVPFKSISECQEIGRPVKRDIEVATRRFLESVNPQGLKDKLEGLPDDKQTELLGVLSGIASEYVGEDSDGNEDVISQEIESWAEEHSDEDLDDVQELEVEEKPVRVEDTVQPSIE
jgi:hypothetical protein